MLKACNDEDLYLVVERDQMQVAIKTDESFGAITVGWFMCSRVRVFMYFLGFLYGSSVRRMARVYSTEMCAASNTYRWRLGFSSQT